MAIGDLYQIALSSNFEGKQAMLNVFHYEHQEGSHSLEDVGNEFIAEVVPVIQAMYYTTHTFDEVICRNLFNPADAVDIPITLAGTRAGAAEALPTHDSVATRLLHLNPAIRQGYKRWPMCYEGDNNDGILEAGFLVFLENVGLKLLDNLFAGVGGPETDDLVLSVVKRILVSPGVYRLPANLGEAAWGQVIDYLSRPRITTQNTRKRYDI